MPGQKTDITNTPDLMTTNYLALLAGGIGPDVWDKDYEISAVDFRDAFEQANGRAEELGGCVVRLEQNDYPQPTDGSRIDAIERLGIELAPRRGTWNCLIADSGISQRGVSSGPDLRRAIDSAVKELEALGEKSFELA